jgi:hypothetical protein
MTKRLSLLIGLLTLVALLWLLRDAIMSQITPSSLRTLPIQSNNTAESSAVSSEKDLKDADVRLLFVGNSHTHSQDLPGRVVKLLQHFEPNKKFAGRTVSVAFLDQAASDPNIDKILKEHPWSSVILQAQKISSSGRTEYSCAEGIDLARRAKALNLPVYFFAEWGLKGSADSTARTHKIYLEMADASDATLIPVGLAWDKILQQSPDLPLYDFDGNHQSSLGADLTALVIASVLTNRPCANWQNFLPTTATREQWKIFTDNANTPESSSQ